MLSAGVIVLSGVLYEAAGLSLSQSQQFLVLYEASTVLRRRRWLLAPVELSLLIPYVCSS